MVIKQLKKAFNRGYYIGAVFKIKMGLIMNIMKMTEVFAQQLLQLFLQLELIKYAKIFLTKMKK